MIHIDPEAAREIHIATRNNHPDGLIHPKRIMNVHVILYCLGGSMEIYEDGIPYTMNENDVLFLCAGIIHYGEKMCTPGTKLYALHLTTAENDSLMWVSMSSITCPMYMTPCSRHQFPS